MSNCTIGGGSCGGGSGKKTACEPPSVDAKTPEVLPAKDSECAQAPQKQSTCPTPVKQLTCMSAEKDCISADPECAQAPQKQFSCPAAVKQLTCTSAEDYCATTVNEDGMSCDETVRLAMDRCGWDKEPKECFEKPAVDEQMSTSSIEVSPCAAQMNICGVKIDPSEVDFDPCEVENPAKVNTFECEVKMEPCQVKPEPTICIQPIVNLPVTPDCLEQDIQPPPSSRLVDGKICTDELDVIAKPECRPTPSGCDSATFLEEVDVPCGSKQKPAPVPDSQCLDPPLGALTENLEEVQEATPMEETLPKGTGFCGGPSDNSCEVQPLYIDPNEGKSGTSSGGGCGASGQKKID